MNDQDEMFERATELPASLGCPQHMPTKLPGGFDGVEPLRSARRSDPTVVGRDVPGAPDVEALKKRGAKIKACNDRSHAKMVRIAELANECVLKTTHSEYAPGQYGQDYQTFGKVMCAIRKIVRDSFADVDPDYEMLAFQFARNSFDFSKFQEAMAAVASMKSEDFPGFYYTPGWLCELAKKLEGNGADKALTPEEQSARDREIARQKRKIHWKVYPTKVDLCAMGKTEQNGKVYEVLVNKRKVSDVQDTYGQVKVNGKIVLTVSFTGNAWMLKRILTEGTQALVNYKAKKNRNSRRNYKRRDAAAKQEGK